MGSNINKNIQHVYISKLIQYVLNDCRNIVSSDLQVQLLAAETDNDDELYNLIQYNLDGVSSFQTFCTIQITSEEIRTFLTIVFEHNFFWDLGFRFKILKEKKMITTRTYLYNLILYDIGACCTEH